MPESREKAKRTRRWWVVRLGIVALALALLIGIPGYLALQPEFFKRSADLDARYRAWETSVHAKVACQSCHVPPGRVSRAVYSLKMVGEFYVSRIRPARLVGGFGTPTNAACSSCHVDLRTVSPSGDLNIPHRAHVDVLAIECVSCHAYLVHELSPEGKNVPRMAMCLECHDGEQAKNACSTCHTEKAAPENHRLPEWVVVHPQKQEESDCETCHAWTEKWCVECHSRRPRSHGDTWRSEHRVQVETHRNCEACHEPESCIRCHGEVPGLNFDPTLALVE